LHLCIIIGILAFDFAPIDYLWGGRMKTAVELLQFEYLSFGLQLLFIFIIAVATDKIHLPRIAPFARFLLWPLAILFLLNTLGNLFAKTLFEKSLAIITLILFICVVRLALGERRAK
jgi:hypothetical protein